MSDDKLSAGEVIHLIAALQHNQEAQRQALEAAGAVDPPLARLRAWQAQRLAATYADLLADPQYRAACRFFLDDLYGAHDFSQRDYDAERLHAILARFLPAAMLRLLTDALELNRVSARLDAQLAAVLADMPAAAPPGAPPAITPAAYAEGYRICNNYAERRAQIELLGRVLGEAAHGGRGPIFTIGLRLARAPAHRAGWQELHSFLERGVAACRPMKDIAYFVDTIQQREMAILERIFAGHEHPF